MEDTTDGERQPKPQDRPHTKSSNLMVGKRRSSVRLEPEIWEALREISDREGTTQADLCAMIEARKRPNQTMSSVLRTFVVAYFRNAAHEEWEREKK